MACYHKALALKPDYAEAYIGIGGALIAQSKADKAVISYYKALSLKPDFAEAHCSLGIALQILGKLDAATEHLHKALSLKPDFAEAHIGLAAVYMDRGQFDAAQAALSKALEFQEEHPMAWAMLIGIRKMTLEDESLLNTALRLAFKPTLAEKDKCTLQFAIGKYYDDTGQFDLAFSFYQQANALKRQREGAFGRAGFSRLIDTLIATYSADFISRQHAGASPSALPVLIVGMPRSGTSLLEQIIASHPQAYGAGELPFWDDRFAAHQAEMLSGNFGATLIADAAAAYESLLRRHSAAALRIVDKMPGNFLWAGFHRPDLPAGKNSPYPPQRNPYLRVNILPATPCPPIPMGPILDDLPFYYRDYSTLMHHWRSVSPADRFLEVSYEELTDNQAVCSRRITRVHRSGMG